MFRRKAQDALKNWIEKCTSQFQVSLQGDKLPVDLGYLYKT